MIINSFLKTSPLLFVFTLWVALLHICAEALFVALLLPDSGTGVPSVPQGQRRAMHHLCSLTLHHLLGSCTSCRKGTFSPWKDGPLTTTPFFPAPKREPFLYWHLVQEREVRLFAPFLLTDALLRICTGHLQDKSPHQACAFLRQKTDIFYGKHILKMHQILYYWSPPSVPCAWFLRCHAKWMYPPQGISS